MSCSRRDLEQDLRCLEGAIARVRRDWPKKTAEPPLRGALSVIEGMLITLKTCQEDEETACP